MCVSAKCCTGVLMLQHMQRFHCSLVRLVRNHINLTRAASDTWPTVTDSWCTSSVEDVDIDLVCTHWSTAGDSGRRCSSILYCWHRNVGVERLEIIEIIVLLAKI